MSNDEIIIVRETPPGVVKQVNEIIIERGAGQGLPGAAGEAPTAQNIGDVIAGAEAKTELVDDDGIGVSNSEDGDILVKWTYASLKAQVLAYIKTAYKTIPGQYDTRTDLTATDASTMTLNYSLGNAFKIDATAMGAGESFTITVSNVPAGAVYSAITVLLVTGANLPTVSYTNLDPDVTDPVLVASKRNELIGRTYDNGATWVWTVGESF